MSAPTKNRVEVDTVSSRDRSAEQMSSAAADDRTAERVTQLLNEIIAKGVLPAL